MSEPKAVRRPGRPRRFDPETEVALIINAAKKLLAENDYEDVSVDAILTESGLSTRSFYRHFATKDELLVMMYRQNAQRLAARLEERVRAADSPQAAVEAWVDELLRLRFDARAATRVRMFDSPSARRAAGYDEAAAEAISLLVQPMERALHEGKAAGIFPLADPPDDAGFIHALVWEAIRRHPDLTRDEARAHVLRFALAGLGAAPDSSG